MENEKEEVRNYILRKITGNKEIQFEFFVKNNRLAVVYGGQDLELLEVKTAFRWHIHKLESEDKEND